MYGHGKHLVCRVLTSVPGTLVHVTAVHDHRGMTRDPSAYPEPEEFRPERHLRTGKLAPSKDLPTSFIFGFGRR